MEWLFLWAALAIGVGFLANSRGRSGIGYFLLSVLLSPILGLIVVLVQRNLVDQLRQEEQRKADQAAHVESIRAIAQSNAGAIRADGASLADELDKLAALKEKGHLTPEEFAAQKAKLLAR